jgi:hypothetical protein
MGNRNDGIWFAAGFLVALTPPLACGGDTLTSKTCLRLSSKRRPSSSRHARGYSQQRWRQSSGRRGPQVDDSCAEDGCGSD